MLDKGIGKQQDRDHRNAELKQRKGQRKGLGACVRIAKSVDASGKIGQNRQQRDDDGEHAQGFDKGKPQAEMIGKVTDQKHRKQQIISFERELPCQKR